MTMDTGKTVTVLGRKYPVQLVEGDYMNPVKFRVDLGDENYLEAPSFRQLEDRAREVKDVRFALEITTGNGINGTVTGFHAANGNALVHWASGKKSQEPWYSLSDAMPRLGDEDYAELRRLIQARADAEKAWREFVKARQYEDAKEAASLARARKAGITA